MGVGYVHGEWEWDVQMCMENGLKNEGRRCSNNYE